MPLSLFQETMIRLSVAKTFREALRMGTRSIPYFKRGIEKRED